MVIAIKKGGREETFDQKFDINIELENIAKQNALPPRIVNRIKEKLNELNININRNQFYKLIETVQSALKSQGITGLTNINYEQKTNFPKESYVNDDMKQLTDSIERLEERIDNIEKGFLKDGKKFSGKLIQTKDIKTLDDNDIIFHEEMEPLLEIPNDPESIVVLMRWLQYLVDKIGKDNLANILGYYVDIDWISDDVRLDIIKYAKGIAENNIKDTLKKGITNLTTKDHIQSLLFIQKLKGFQIDDRFIWKIDREMDKLAKSIEENQIK